MNAFLSCYSGGQSVTFTNIPYANYSLYAYLTSPSPGVNGTASVGGPTYYFSTDAFSGGNFAGYTAITSTNSSNYAPGDYVVFSGLSGSSLTFSDSMANPSSAGIAAIELVPSGVGAAGVATLPSTTPLQIGSGTFDLNGGSQHVASVSDYSGGGGSIINSNTATMAVLTISPTGTTTACSGSILSGGTDGAIALVLNGSGTQILSGADTYSGGTDVEDGTLILASPAALEEGTSLTVGNASAFDDAVSGGQAAPLADHALAAVPEPSALVLLVVSLWSAVIYHRFFRRSKTAACRSA